MSRDLPSLKESASPKSVPIEAGLFAGDMAGLDAVMKSSSFADMAQRMVGLDALALKSSSFMDAARNSVGLDALALKSSSFTDVAQKSLSLDAALMKSSAFMDTARMVGLGAVALPASGFDSIVRQILGLDRAIPSLGKDQSISPARLAYIESSYGSVLPAQSLPKSSGRRFKTVGSEPTKNGFLSGELRRDTLLNESLVTHAKSVAIEDVSALRELIKQLQAQLTEQMRRTDTMNADIVVVRSLTEWNLHHNSPNLLTPQWQLFIKIVIVNVILTIINVATSIGWDIIKYTYYPHLK